ncbi:nitrogen fixation protein FixH [Kaistella flava (ex Peng et al. 2021)]|uniref:Nitrogen fixation protein FixH n=1 Tax=Kaistella flava (ex Peng et al. 2021) TaxID=2038776 RepID=A0A7M2YAI7_9FLAO|nr:FixH family protein [Kaistella flava (ex Peng et al. 2021)]QOW11287.1 nitrogen fixation protein FixH [Kaistella flava (ex Peng et al. 2021)]
MFKKLTWAHGVVIALGSFIAFILFMVFGFTYGQQTSELVSNDYYGDELVYQQVIDAKRNAEQLTEIPKYQELAEGMKITFPAAIAPENKNVKFELFRTDDANLDVKKEINLDANNEILVPKQVISKGPYTLKIKWSHDKKPYQVDYDVLWK